MNRNGLPIRQEFREEWMNWVQAPKPPQHLRALQQANRVRLARAELKRQVGVGARTAAEIILECPWEAESMPIGDLLLSQHRWGRMRCRRFLASLSLVETKTIGSLTDRQRRAISARLLGEDDGLDAVTGTPDLALAAR